MTRREPSTTAQWIDTRSRSFRSPMWPTCWPAWRTPATTCCRSPSAAVVTMVAVSGSGTTPSSSTSAACAAHQLTRWPVRSGSMAVVSGVMLIMPPERSEWRCPRASCPPPGLAGLTLGGGVGYLTRRFGLTIDNLVSADVVLADGRFVTASAESHSDLFWALRGGGGNFGVVTSFTFRCHPIGEQGVIIGGPVLYDIADVEDLFRWYRDLLPTLPDELSGVDRRHASPRRPAIP